MDIYIYFFFSNYSLGLSIFHTEYKYHTAQERPFYFSYWGWFCLNFCEPMHHQVMMVVWNRCLVSHNNRLCVSQHQVLVWQTRRSWRQHMANHVDKSDWLGRCCSVFSDESLASVKVPPTVAHLKICSGPAMAQFQLNSTRLCRRRWTQNYLGVLSKSFSAICLPVFLVNFWLEHFTFSCCHFASVLERHWRVSMKLLLYVDAFKPAFSHF